MKMIKKVQFTEPAEQIDSSELLVELLHESAQDLVPDTQLWIAGRHAYSINSLGCKGPELRPDLPVVAVLGGSYAFGSLLRAESVFDYVGLPGYQLLNAAIPGTGVTSQIKKQATLQAAVSIAACVFIPEPAPQVLSASIEQDCAAALEQLKHCPRPIVCTCPPPAQASSSSAEIYARLNTFVRGAAQAHALAFVDLAGLEVPADSSAAELARGAELGRAVQNILTEGSSRGTWIEKIPLVKNLLGTKPPVKEEHSKAPPIYPLW